MSTKKETTKQEVTKVASPEVQAEAKPAELVADLTAKKLPKKEDVVLFVSKEKELNVPILAAGKNYVPFLKDGVVVWAVERADADFFAAHSLVEQGRIARALEK